jgi:hypothetical protein
MQDITIGPSDRFFNLQVWQKIEESPQLVFAKFITNLWRSIIFSCNGRESAVNRALDGGTYHQLKASALFSLQQKL